MNMAERGPVRRIDVVQGTCVTREQDRLLLQAKKSGGFVKALCLCLVCALLGGLVGAGLMGRSLTNRIDGLEEQLSEQSTVVLGGESSASTVSTAAPKATEALTGAQIYEQACSQVVGTEVMKNWEPLVPRPPWMPALAMASL